MKNILVAVNFDEKADVLIDKAIELAEKFSSKIWVVHIAAPDPDEFSEYNPDLEYVKDFRVKELKEEHRLIQVYAEKIRHKGIDAEGLLIQGPTVGMLLIEAEKLNADIIIIEHHEHGFLHKLFLGSTSGDLISKTKTPVLLIPF